MPAAFCAEAEGKIAKISAAKSEPESTAEVFVDCSEKLLLPGFVTLGTEVEAVYGNVRKLEVEGGVSAFLHTFSFRVSCSRCLELRKFENMAREDQQISAQGALLPVFESAGAEARPRTRQLKSTSFFDNRELKYE